MKILSKLLIAGGVLIVYFGVTAFYAYYTMENQKKAIYIELSNQLKNKLTDEKKYFQDIGLTDADLIADRQDIKQALLTNNRKLAINTLQKISNDFKQSTNITDMKIHIHTADTKSFVRSWKLNKYGDDLTDFRKAVVKVRETNEPYFGFEVGRMGLTLRSIVPIINKNQCIGTLEFIQNFDTVAKTFKAKNYQYLLLMNESLMNIATYLNKSPTIDKYRVSSKEYDMDFLNRAKTINFNKLKKDNYYLSDTYFYTYDDIKSPDNVSIGMHLLSMPYQEVQTAIENAKSTVYTSIALKSIFLLLCFGAFILISILISSSQIKFGKRNGN
jgi:methyl-accepting chemotaxis protein